MQVLNKRQVNKYRSIYSQQTQTCTVMKSSHLSSGICLLWLGFVFPHFLSTPNIKSTLFKKSSMEKLLTLLLHPQAADLWTTMTASKQHLSDIFPSVQPPRAGPLQPMESYCCHPTSHDRNHIPKEEQQFLIDRLFGFLLIKQSIYKILNKYTAVSDASVPHTPTWRALCSYK